MSPFLTAALLSWELNVSNILLQSDDAFSSQQLCLVARRVEHDVVMEDEHRGGNKRIWWWMPKGAAATRTVGITERQLELQSGAIAFSALRWDECRHRQQHCFSQSGRLALRQSISGVLRTNERLRRYGRSSWTMALSMPSVETTRRW